ncbi:protein O-mannosyl-transferase TMTC2 [Caerostris extrusa]|uniref:Protein O-mannosyl-transferase TMTC2 n=1 Tax=Caerostris extrusa TaxID=172846 RepID=A0AAV4M7C5_CAEEX|nr:protein O-mannosyl-transferase TMTC2 [Caerostris extrusa]
MMPLGTHESKSDSWKKICCFLIKDFLMPSQCETRYPHVPIRTFTDPEIPSYAFIIPLPDVYRHCAELDSSGLKDPKMHETTKISALFNLGRLYADDGSYKQAIKVYQEAVKKMPHHYQPQSLYNMMGEAFFKLKQFEEAERWYQQALRAKADHIPAHLTYAKLLSKWDRLSEAEQWFLKAKAIAPNDSSVYQHYGQFLSENERDIQAGRNEDAEHYYQVAVKLRPKEVTSHINLGAMLHVNGKLQEAEEAYLAALRLKPDDPITQNNLQKLRNKNCSETDEKT